MLLWEIRRSHKFRLSQKWKFKIHRIYFSSKQKHVSKKKDKLYLSKNLLSVWFTRGLYFVFWIKSNFVSQWPFLKIMCSVYKSNIFGQFRRCSFVLRNRCPKFCWFFGKVLSEVWKLYRIFCSLWKKISFFFASTWNIHVYKVSKTKIWAE